MVLPTVTLTGTYVRPDGESIRGWIDFCPPSVLAFADEPTFIACCSRVRLDENGQFSVDLVATDAEGASVENWTYRVEENLDCPGGQRTYRIELGQDTNPVDLAQIAPTTRPPNLNYLRLPGPPGPIGPSGVGAPSLGTYMLVPETETTADGAFPVDLTLEGDGHGVTIVDGEAVIGVAGLWAFNATLTLTAPAPVDLTATLWAQWDAGDRTSRRLVTTGTADADGFDCVLEALLPLEADDAVALYLEVDNPTAATYTVTGRAVTGALLLREV